MRSPFNHAPVLSETTGLILALFAIFALSTFSIRYSLFVIRFKIWWWSLPQPLVDSWSGISGDSNRFLFKTSGPGGGQIGFFSSGIELRGNVNIKHTKLTINTKNYKHTKLRFEGEAFPPRIRWFCYSLFAKLGRKLFAAWNILCLFAFLEWFCWGFWNSSPFSAYKPARPVFSFIFFPSNCNTFLQCVYFCLFFCDFYPNPSNAQCPNWIAVWSFKVNRGQFARTTCVHPSRSTQKYKPSQIVCFHVAMWGLIKIWCVVVCFDQTSVAVIQS